MKVVDSFQDQLKMVTRLADFFANLKFQKLRAYLRFLGSQDLPASSTVAGYHVIT